MPLWEEFSYLPLAFIITAGAAGAVICPLFLWMRGPRLLPMQRIRKGNWSGAEVWLAFLVWLFASSLAIHLLDWLGFYEAIGVTFPSLRAGLWAFPLSLLLTLALVFLVLFQTSRTRPSNLGLSCARWRENTVVGYLGFLGMTPLVFGLNVIVFLVLQVMFDSTPQDHPFRSLSKEALTLPEWSLLIGEATLGASLSEELLFRGVLQPWLRRASLPGHVMMIVVTLAWGLDSFIQSVSNYIQRPDGEINVGPLIFAFVAAVAYSFALYWVRISAPKDQNSTRLAIFGSSMVWAAFHSNFWPTPVPLLFFGLGLGYLAYRTQNLLPGMIVHGLFNAVSCVQLVLQQTNPG